MEARPKGRPAKARPGETGAEPLAPPRERMIEAAERLFAQFGFDGTSVRQIALAAKVPLALVSYHFGGKEGLYRTIFELRSPTIIDQRIAGLKIAAMETDPDQRLKLVLQSILMPMIHLRHTEKSASFARIMAREVMDPSSVHRNIVSDIFDPIARLMIEALTDAMPGQSFEHVHWGYHTIIGSMVFVMGDPGRIARLSDGRCDPDDEAATTAHMVALMYAALKYGSAPPRG